MVIWAVVDRTTAHFYGDFRYNVVVWQFLWVRFLAGYTKFMNALPSFNPPPQSPQPRKSTRKRSSRNDTPAPKTATGKSSLNRAESRVKSNSNPAYAHRRQGLEVSVKLVTYSALSVFGIVTLVNLLAYNWSQQSKLQHLQTELKDAQARTQKINSSFNRSFDLQSQPSVMAENSYKIDPDRLPIVVVSPASKLSTK